MEPPFEKMEAPFEKMAAPRKKIVPLNFQTAPPFRHMGPQFGKKMLNLIKTKQKIKRALPDWCSQR